MQTLRFIHDKSGLIIGDQIIRANTPLSRIRGLLGKRDLEEGAGVWLQPSSGVHTFGMQFAIDVMGLNQELRVVRIWAHLRPHRMTSIDFRVKSVVELAAGMVEAHRIQLGDHLRIAWNMPLPSPQCPKKASFPGCWF